MKRIIFKYIAVFSFVVTLICFFALSGGLASNSYDIIRRNLLIEVENLAFATKENGEGYIFTYATDSILTLVDSNGNISLDGRFNPSERNVMLFPEVISAFESGFGEDRRIAKDLTIQSSNFALLLENGKVIMLSKETKSVYGEFIGLIPAMMVSFIMIFSVSYFISVRLSVRISNLLGNLNVESPMLNDSDDELSELMSRVKRNNDVLQSKIFSLRRRQEQFAAVTLQMREGLILLNDDEKILSINRSAFKMLGISDAQVEGKHIIEIYRNMELMALAEKSGEGHPGEMTIERAGRIYQILASPAGENGGSVLLMMDATERLAAENMRREFSANVSHELKTPLTSILGYAELIENGMAQSADINRFAGVIRKEAGRLIELVGGIIRISHLDEDVELPSEQVELLSLCKTIAERMKPQAEPREIEISVKGEPAIIPGSPMLLDEMVSNLVDNAIKYNRDGGRVDISLITEGDNVSLIVSDNGIGIPEEHQGRIFERFYRVDKSHSKETGGSGLGLSIVKHGAAYHKAKLWLESTEGEGTTIGVCFDMIKGEESPF